MATGLNKYPRQSVFTDEQLSLYNDEIEMIEGYKAQLESVRAETSSPMTRAIAQSYIVQLALDKPTKLEDVDMFLCEALNEIDREQF